MVEQKPTILIIEDDPLMYRMYQKKFELEGYKVLIKEDGEEALAVLSNERPDIILLDLMMPKMDGFEFLQLLKQKPGCSDIPVVLLTNVTGDMGYSKKGLELGANSYLVKSQHTPAEVVEKVEEVLRSS